MQPSTYVCSPPPLCTMYAEMQFLYGRTCSQYSTVHSSDTAVNGVSVTVLLTLHALFYCAWVWQLLGSVPTWRHFCWTEDPHTGWLTEDFTAVLSLLFSNASVTPGSTDVPAVFINDEIFVEFTPVHDCERVVILKISSLDVGALNYSVEVDLLPGTSQSKCIMRFLYVVLKF